MSLKTLKNTDMKKIHCIQERMEEGESGSPQKGVSDETKVVTT